MIKIFKKVFKFLCTISYTIFVFLAIVIGVTLFQLENYRILAIGIEIMSLLVFMFPVVIASELDIKNAKIKALEGIIEIMRENSKYEEFGARISYVDGIYFGYLTNTSDLVTFQAGNVNEIATEFRKAIDDYLELCKDVGKRR